MSLHITDTTEIFMYLDTWKRVRSPLRSICVFKTISTDSILSRRLVENLPQLGNKGAYLNQLMCDKLVEHKQYIAEYGQDLPEVRDWKWESIND